MAYRRSERGLEGQETVIDLRQHNAFPHWGWQRDPA